MTALPLAPLLDRIASAAGQPIHSDPCPYCLGTVGPASPCLRPRTVAAAVGVSSRRWMRWVAARSIPVDDADRVAVRLGWHPAAVWGPNWHVPDWPFDDE